MKFFFEFISCCGSFSAGKEEKRLLVPAPENRRRVGRRRSGRWRGGRRREWRPSLSSISEDNVLVAERIINNGERPAERWRRSLKGKVSSSVPRRDRARSLDNYPVRRTQLIVPPFAPMPFMF
ncbi:hypothetical protein ABFS83_13G173400 [Erythranthe nasuta]